MYTFRVLKCAFIWIIMWESWKRLRSHDWLKGIDSTNQKQYWLLYQIMGVEYFVDISHDNLCENNFFLWSLDYIREKLGTLNLVVPKYGSTTLYNVFCRQDTSLVKVFRMSLSSFRAACKTEKNNTGSWVGISIGQCSPDSPVLRGGYSRTSEFHCCYLLISRLPNANMNSVVIYSHNKLKAMSYQNKSFGQKLFF